MSAGLSIPEIGTESVRLIGHMEDCARDDASDMEGESAPCSQNTAASVAVAVCERDDMVVISIGPEVEEQSSPSPVNAYSCVRRGDWRDTCLKCTKCCVTTVLCAGACSVAYAGGVLPWAVAGSVGAVALPCLHVTCRFFSRYLSDKKRV
ncbi:MAG: hypothetical protein OXF02_06990 [Simkaniaceae bacterium]|nr:hypothetical protein [Simkaniaceae bacterium]